MSSVPPRTSRVTHLAVDTRTLSAPSYKMVLGVSSSDVDLAFAVGLASQRFKQFAGASPMEVCTPQGFVVSPEQLEGAPISPPPRDPQRQRKAQKILWSKTESKHAAREHEEAERERMVEHELRFENAWRSVAERYAPEIGLASDADQVWEAAADEHLTDECGCGSIADYLCGCVCAALRRCFGTYWRCFQSPSDARRALYKAKVRRARAEYMDWKSMV